VTSDGERGDALGAVFDPDAKRVPWAATTEAIARGIVFLLSFANFDDATLASDGRFTPIFIGITEVLTGSALFFSRAFGRFSTVFSMESTFLFFKTSTVTGVERGP
jgi:hypothetical protein